MHASTEGIRSAAQPDIRNSTMENIFLPEARAKFYTMSMLRILMSSSGRSFCVRACVRAFSILWITSNPCTARPKMVCLLSSHGCLSC